VLRKTIVKNFDNRRDDYFMKKILHDLYRGRFPKGDHGVNTPQIDATREKILSERQYLASIMSAEDFERFRALEALHRECHDQRYQNTYAKAFKLGIMLMCALFMNEEADE